MSNTTTSNRERVGSQDGGEKKPLLASTPTTERRKKSSKGSHRHHRRAQSSSAAMPGPGSYGAFGQQGVGGVDEEQASPRRQVRRASVEQFSPLNEIRKLSQGVSPTGRKNSITSSSRSVTWSPQPPPPPPPLFSGNNNNMNAAPPMVYSPSMSGGGDAYFQQQPNTGSTAPMVYSPSMSGGGGESPYFHQQRTPTSSRKPESLRKMHVRQHSAQVFMEEIKGVEQPLICRNVLFLLLFVFHLLGVVYLGQIYGGEALKYHEDDSEQVTIVYSSLVYIACWSGLFAVLVSALLLSAMMYFAKNFVQIALFVVIALSFIWGTIGIGVSPTTVVPVTGIIALALAVAYTFIVWDRIPFATANLLTALSGIRTFPTIMLVAVGFQVLTLAWSIYFSVVVIGIYDAVQGGKLDLSPRMVYLVYLLLALSFNWTFQVLQGTVEAITAAVIGGWWHEGRTAENGGLVRQSCFKTIFYSMGSICFGSLFVGPVRFLRQVSVLFRPSSSESSSLMCLHECIHCIQSCMASCVDNLAAGCNYWAFTYIGMYHYGFLDAGNNATDLFERCGWSTVVSDDLVPNVLFFTSLVFGGITGCFAHLISRLDGLVVFPNHNTGLAPFVEGVIIGLVLSSVVFSVISSSVNAVLVCFAASPAVFEENHRELSHEMRAAWREVWPGALDVCDARLALERRSSIRSNNSYPEQHPLL